MPQVLSRGEISAMKYKSRFSLFLRSTALVLSLAFLLSDISHAAPVLSFTPNDIIHNPSLLKVSSSIAKIDEVYSASHSRLSTLDSRLIIHIQDAHTNPSAQKNIAKVLEGLI